MVQREAPPGAKPSYISERNWRLYCDRVAGASYTNLGQAYGISRERAKHLCTIVQYRIAHPPQPPWALHNSGEPPEEIYQRARKWVRGQRNRP